MVEFDGHDIRFWISALLAAGIKVVLSRTQSVISGAVTVAVAVFCAWTFTEPTLIWLELKPEYFEIPAAALWALVGEGVVRWLIGLNPDRLIKLWRGQPK